MNDAALHAELRGALDDLLDKKEELRAIDAFLKPFAERARAIRREIIMTHEHVFTDDDRMVAVAALQCRGREERAGMFAELDRLSASCGKEREQRRVIYSELQAIQAAASRIEAAIKKIQAAKGRKNSVAGGQQSLL